MYMKRTLLKRLLPLCLVAAGGLCGLEAYAQEEGYLVPEYWIEAGADGTDVAVVTRLIRGEGPLTDSLDIVIPATVDLGGGEIPVRGIRQNFQAASASVQNYMRRIRSITVKADIDSIEAETFSLSDKSFYRLSGLHTLAFEGRVGKIGDRAFASLPLTSLVLPDGTAERPLLLGKGLIKGCSQLKEMRMPDYSRNADDAAGNFANYTYCGNYAPGGIWAGSALRRAVVPAHTEWGGGAFHSCDSLEQVTVEEGVTRLGCGFFQHCMSLSDISFPSTIEYVGLSSLSGKVDDNDVYHHVPWLEQQPEGMVYIGTVAYDWNGIIPQGTTIDLKPGTTCLSSEFFWDAGVNYSGNPKKFSKELTINIPASMKYLQSTFRADTLIKFVFEEGNPNYILRDGNVYTDGGKTLYGLTSVPSANYTIPSDVENIAVGAFNALDGLDELTIPATVKAVGVDDKDGGKEQKTSFALCNVRKLTVGSDLGMALSVSGETLTDIVCDANNVTIYIQSSYATIGALKSITYTEKVDSLCSIGYLFPDCYADDFTLVLPSRVKYIDELTFGFYPSESLSLPELEYGTASLSENIFRSLYGSPNRRIKHLDLSRTKLEELPAHLLVHLPALASVTMPDGLVTVGADALKQKDGLTEIVLPSTIRQIGSGAFSGCTNLKKVSLYPSQAVRASRAAADEEGSVGDQAFYGCTSLESVALPPTTTSVGAQAFYGCTSLAEITGADNVVSASDPALKGTPYSQLNAGTYYLGKVACGFYWPEDTPAKIELRPGTVAIIDSAFYSKERALSYPITIPHSMREIGKAAFSDTMAKSGLLSDFFIIQNGVERIGEGAFYRYTITDTLIVLPASLKQLGNRAFRWEPSADCRLYMQGDVPMDYDYVSRLSHAMGGRWRYTPTLYVPAGTKEAYEAMNYASLFASIEEYDELPTGIEAVEADGTSAGVSLTGSGVRVAGAAEVYTPDGRLYRAVSGAGEVSLPAGQIFIVRQGGRSVKVMR